MQVAKMPDGTIVIQLHNDAECNSLGVVLMGPILNTKVYDSNETQFASRLSNQLAWAMQFEHEGPADESIPRH